MRLAFAIAISLVMVASALGEELTAVPNIADADTVYLGNVEVRFIGVDAPETEQRCLDAAGAVWSCGFIARDRLQAFSSGRPWTCQLGGKDRYGRRLGTCTVGGEDVQRWLVRNGLALAFRRYSTAYVRDEDAARANKVGLWAGAFISPWDWRQRGANTVILGATRVPVEAQQILVSPATAAKPPDPDCVIKGNLGRSDQCIYHVPGGRYYNQLNMDKTGSRRWFCSEAEAQAAGCRRSKI